MPLASLVGALVLSTPSLGAFALDPAPRLELLSPAPAPLLRLVPSARIQTMPKRVLGAPSQHREGEGGAVILEMGPSGLRRLHCEGHRFPAAK
jgi:hypothetical protein